MFTGGDRASDTHICREKKMRARKYHLTVSMMKMIWVALFLTATHYFITEKFFIILKSLKFFSDGLSFVKFAFVKIFKTKPIHNILI